MPSRGPVICVHKMNGHPAFVHVDRDSILLSKRPVVVVMGNGGRFEVKESRKEIEAFIKEVR